MTVGLSREQKATMVKGIINTLQLLDDEQVLLIIAEAADTLIARREPEEGSYHEEAE